MKFKEGDVLVCIEDAVPWLTFDSQYSVIERSAGMVRVKDNIGAEDWWDNSRFKLAPTAAEPVKPDTVLGTQVGGDHYTRQAIQPIEYIWANNLGFSEGNIIKYATRWKYKGGIKDLEKLVHHGNLLIEEARRQEAKGVKFGLHS